mmetsp:Transcript_35150/g.49176  ORF Transcript_35150/g.49176 Transcript_35150/m.49176 type:complete len:302 (+) Transcript_35150:587-1492(+)
MREVVCRVDAPVVSNVRVRLVDDAVGDDVPHVRVVVRDIHLKPQRGLAFAVVPFPHPVELIQALLDRPVSPRAWGLPLLELLRLLHLFAGHVAHVGLVLFDEAHGEVVELLERVRAVCYLPDVVPHELDVLNDVIDVFLLFGLRICVVKSQVAHPSHLLRDPKVEVHRLRMADVQEPVRLWREPHPHFPLCPLQMGGLNFITVLIPRDGPPTKQRHQVFVGHVSNVDALGLLLVGFLRVRIVLALLLLARLFGRLFVVLLGARAKLLENRLFELLHHRFLVGPFQRLFRFPKQLVLNPISL